MQAAVFLKQAWPKLVEATGNPLAPIILQEAHANADRLGKMLAQAPDTSRQLTTDYSNLFLQWMQDAESEGQEANAEFVLALAGLFTAAIIAYTVKHSR